LCVKSGLTPTITTESRDFKPRVEQMRAFLSIDKIREKYSLQFGQ
jgi:hypothetical protein